MLKSRSCCVLAFSAEWTAADAGRAGAIAARAMWTQLRLYRADLVDTDACQLCGEPCAGYIHRYWRCPCTERERREWWADDEHTVRLARLAPEGHPFFCHGLLARDELPLFQQQPRQQQQTRWARGAAGTFISGVAYIDGSVRHPDVPAAARYGWSVVQLAARVEEEPAVGRIPMIRHGHGGALQAMRDAGFDVPVPPVVRACPRRIGQHIASRMAEQGVTISEDAVDESNAERAL